MPTSEPWPWRRGLLVLCLATLPACAARQFAFPTDPGSPLPDAVAIHQQVSAACRAIRTFTAELSLAGTAGGQRIRGRVVAGFERSDAMRLEGVAPFGPPAFILVTRGGDASMLLPRENSVLRDASAGEILGALTGVTLEPADLESILSGCVLPSPQAVAGRLHRNGWATIDLAGDGAVYLARRDGVWQVRGGRRENWEVEYPAWQGTFPSQVRLRSTRPGIAVDLTATISQLAVNTELDAAVFEVTIPEGARTITLDDIQRAGTLRDPDSGR
jgi:outer membrane lipoprotein-sorting protein